MSVLVANHMAPPATTYDASARSFQPMSGLNPWTTATGDSAALCTGLSPTNSISWANAALPVMRTCAPAGSMEARSSPAACEELTT
ncbi:hypothetical protein PJL18_04083 [Paenarthrobacter nicotinovorans]|nr:hypothetical protein [Paenarthrobacter nicotinovorans]